MTRVITLLKILLTFTFLTLLTQIGGIVYLISLWFNYLIKIKFRFKKSILFICLYLIITFLVIPLIAPIFGRESIKHSNKIHPTNYFTVLLNRNYVSPKMNHLLANLDSDLEHTPIHISYLDANFPFIDGFPLLPHLSHNDGKKLDISLIYEQPNRIISPKQKSFTGYGVFENPNSSEYNQINKCIKEGYFQYDYTKYVKLFEVNKSLTFSHKGTKQLINTILKQPALEKLFIEPHLKYRLQLQHQKVRFHGCKAVRHDDHIHIQIK